MISNLQFAPPRDSGAHGALDDRAADGRPGSFASTFERAANAERAPQNDASSRKERTERARGASEEDRDDDDVSTRKANRAAAARSASKEIGDEADGPTEPQAVVEAVPALPASERGSVLPGEEGSAEDEAGSAGNEDRSLVAATSPGRADTAEETSRDAQASSSSRSSDAALRGTADATTDTRRSDGAAAAKAPASADGDAEADADDAAPPQVRAASRSTRLSTESAARAALSAEQTTDRINVAVRDAAPASPAVHRAAEVEQAIRTEQAAMVAERGEARDASKAERSGVQRGDAAAPRSADAATLRGVERSLTTLASLRGGRMELTLDPAELGRVQVRMAMRGSAVRVEIVTQQAQAADRLHAQLQELRLGLERQGLHVERITVQSAPESASSQDRGLRGEQYGAPREQEAHERSREDGEGRSRGQRDEREPAQDETNRERASSWVDALRRLISGDAA